MLNLEHYKITSTHFWQLYFDRLTQYFSVTSQATITSVKFSPTSDIEINCTNRLSILPLLANLFQAYEKDCLIVLPSYYMGGYQINKALWLFCPQLFDKQENKLIFEAFVHFFYGRTFPKQFTTQFLKYLNRILDLKDVIRKSGVQQVNFTDDGVEFIWPIFFQQQNSPQRVIEATVPGVSFTRDEPKAKEVLLVSYDFAWEAINGTSWSGDLRALFEKNELFQNVQTHLTKVDTDKYAYCAERVRKQFNLDTPEFTKTLED